MYQRSLLRIKTDDELFSDSSSEKKLKKLSICSKEIEITCYDDEVSASKFKKI